MGFFERYLTLWVGICIVVGIILGQLTGDSIKILSNFNISTVNVPVAVLVWLMIYPMMVQIDFSSIRKVGANPQGLALTLIINWLIKPFTMALLRVDLLWQALRGLFESRACSRIYCRCYSFRGRSLYRNGLCMVLPHRWRSWIHSSSSCH